MLKLRLRSRRLGLAPATHRASHANGEIVIDETNNAHLRAAFETNLVGFVECEHGEDH